MPTEKHPKPYKVAWVDDHSITMTGRCLVPFKIWICEDEMWCDIIPMNIAHILLGQPWLFDREVYTDQKRHMHSFEWKGQMAGLLPLPPLTSSSASPTPSNHHALTMRKFED